MDRSPYAMTFPAMKRIFLRALLIGAAAGLALGLWIALDSYADIHQRMQSEGPAIYAQIAASGNEMAQREAAEMLRFAEQRRSFAEITLQSMGYASFWVVFLPIFLLFFLVTFLTAYVTLMWQERHRLLEDDEA